jgi:hypothetical protein
MNRILGPRLSYQHNYTVQKPKHISEADPWLRDKPTRFSKHPIPLNAKLSYGVSFNQKLSSYLDAFKNHPTQLEQLKT